jgi:hypothetical protein
MAFDFWPSQISFRTLFSLPGIPIPIPCPPRSRIWRTSRCSTTNPKFLLVFHLIPYYGVFLIFNANAFVLGRAAGVCSIRLRILPSVLSSRISSRTLVRFGLWVSSWASAWHTMAKLQVEERMIAEGKNGEVRPC